MQGTYTQIHIQIVFAVKNRQALIQPEWEETLYKYITGITQAKGQKMLAINGTSNHIHLFIGLKPTCCLSDLVREIKKASSVFVRESHYTKFHFEWQEGYGAFSYNHSAIDAVVKYILNQKEHHQRHSFKDEYVEFLRKFDIPYKEQFLFDWID